MERFCVRGSRCPKVRPGSHVETDANQFVSKVRCRTPHIASFESVPAMMSIDGRPPIDINLSQGSAAPFDGSGIPLEKRCECLAIIANRQRLRLHDAVNRDAVSAWRADWRAVILFLYVAYFAAKSARLHPRFTFLMPMAYRVFFNASARAAKIHASNPRRFDSSIESELVIHSL